MATNPAWIGTPRGGQWTITLITQVFSRASTPNSSCLVLTAGSGGARIMDIIARPLGTNVASVLNIWAFNPVGNVYNFIGSQALGASTAPSAGSDFSTPANGLVRCSNTLPVTLFPASSTTTPNQALEIGPNIQIYAALDTSVASGWVVSFFGGDI